MSKKGREACSPAFVIIDNYAFLIAVSPAVADDLVSADTLPCGIGAASWHHPLITSRLAVSGRIGISGIRIVIRVWSVIWIRVRIWAGVKTGAYVNTASPAPASMTMPCKTHSSRH